MLGAASFREIGAITRDSPTLLVCLLLLGVLAAWAYLQFFYIDFKRIEGIPEIPGGPGLYGHLKALGQDHASSTERWAIERQWPVFQIRMGNRRVLFLNGFNVAREWLVTHQASTVDRPLFYTFHGVISKTSAATIGTNPWSDRTRKQRLVVGSLTTAPAIKRLTGLIDLETSQMISSLLEDGKGGDRRISWQLSQKRLALNIILMFCYGKRFETTTDPLLKQILDDAATISTFRSTNSNAQDYVPYLRYIPKFLKDQTRMKVATEVRTRRDKWLANLLQEVRDKSAAGEKANCVAAGLIEDTDSKLTQIDVRTILGGLVSGGFDTIANTLVAGIMYLATGPGQEAQQKGYDDIIKAYGSPEEAWSRAVHDESSPYIVAFVREVLRQYPPIHILSARSTIKEFVDSNGVRIPKGLMLLVNCQAVNHDISVYGPDAYTFRPERWLDPTSSSKIPPPYEFAFGAGSRMCTAVNFSNRILYAAFLRLIVAFKISGLKGQEEKDALHYVDYNQDTTAASACAKDFEGVFEIRDRRVLEECLRVSREQTVNVSNGVVR